MKKKIQSISHAFRMPHLFREDLEDLEAVINELSPKEYKFESRAFEYKAVKEVPEDLRVTNEFHIQTYSPYISVDLNASRAWIYAGDDSIKTIGAVKKMIEVISKRERRILYWLSKLSAWIAPILFIAPIQAVAEVVKEKGSMNLSKIWIVFLFPIVGVIWWVIGYRSSLHKFSVVELVFRKSRSTFFVRNKDQIILITIGALVGALATIFFQKIFR